MQSSSCALPFKQMIAGASPATDTKPYASRPRSSVRSERHPAKVEVAGATPAVDTILPLCLSSHRTGFVNSYSSVRVRPEAPFHVGHDVTAASRPVTAPVRVQIPLANPISTDNHNHQPGGLMANKINLADAPCFRDHQQAPSRFPVGDKREERTARRSR